MGSTFSVDVASGAPACSPLWTLSSTRRIVKAFQVIVVVGVVVSVVTIIGTVVVAS